MIEMKSFAGKIVETSNVNSYGYLMKYFPYNICHNYIVSLFILPQNILYANPLVLSGHSIEFEAS